MKQVDVARAIGVDEMTIVNWEKYETMPMRNQHKIQKLCTTLGVSFEWIMGTFPYHGLLNKVSQTVLS